MKKTDEISNPNSCLNRAADNEPLFVLRGKDITAPDTIRDWAERRVNAGKNERSDPQIQEALALADQMVEYQEGLAAIAAQDSMQNEGGQSAEAGVIDDLNQGAAIQ